MGFRHDVLLSRVRRSEHHRFRQGTMRLRPSRRWTREPYRLPVGCRSAYCQLLGAGERDGRTAMAKGQKRSNREPKKPKADKKKNLASTGTASSTPGKPKHSGAKTEAKT
jgi:hypothetical protein